MKARKRQNGEKGGWVISPSEAAALQGGRAKPASGPDAEATSGGRLERKVPASHGCQRRDGESQSPALPLNIKYFP